MALLAYAEHLMPEDVKDPVTGFLESGLHQVVRVFHGPRPRKEIPSGVGYKKKQTRCRQQQLLPWQRQKEKPVSSLQGEQDTAEGLERHSRKQGAAFVLASLPASPLLFADTDAKQLQLRLLSDTVRHIFAGTAARTMSQAFIHPIDTVKTRLQINKLTAPAQLQNWRQLSKLQRVELFLGSRRVLSLRNWAVQGPVDLYRGLTGAVLGTIPVAAVYFSAYETSKSFLERRGASGAVAHLASASVGAVLSAFIRVPTDTLKHRTQAYIVPDIFQGARSIVASQGIGGLYHGLLPTLLRDVPELALQFSIYETLRRYVEAHRKVEKLRTWEHLALGGLSGATAASATMPLDVAKTALQCGNGRSISLVFREVVRDKGVAGLFAGMGPRVAQIALQGAIFFTLFEAWKARLKPLRFEDDRLMAPKLWRKRRGHVWKRQFVFQ